LAKEARIIAHKADIRIEHFVCGNIDHLIDELSNLNLQPNIICSFAVIEHIYNLEEWFSSLSRLRNKFCAVFLTSANPYNPFIRNRLMKLHQKTELEHSEESWGEKKSDLKMPFLLARKEIIQSELPQANEETLLHLARETRGLKQTDIISEIKKYQSSGKLQYKPKHPTNTCDPYTGNWTEQLIDIPELKKILQNLNFQVEIFSGLYSYGANAKLNIIKSILNRIIRLNSTFGLHLSAIYLLKVKN